MKVQLLEVYLDTEIGDVAKLVYSALEHSDCPTRANAIMADLLLGNYVAYWVHFVDTSCGIIILEPQYTKSSLHVCLATGKDWPSNRAWVWPLWRELRHLARKSNLHWVTVNWCKKWEWFLRPYGFYLAEPIGVLRKSVWDN